MKKSKKSLIIVGLLCSLILFTLLSSNTYAQISSYNNNILTGFITADWWNNRNYSNWNNFYNSYSTNWYMPSGNISYNQGLSSLYNQEWGNAYNSNWENSYNQSRSNTYYPNWGGISTTGTNRKLEKLAYLKVNLTASDVPSANDDSIAGYSVGSRWINVSTENEYVCVDDAEGQAVWIKTTSSDADKLDNEDGDYYLSRSNHTGAQAISTVTGLQTALDGKELAIGTKNTAFNKNFGSTAGTVTEGNDARLSDSRKCDNTFDDAATAKANLSLSKSDVGLGNVENLKMNLAATQAPTVNDDDLAGYAVGSRWVDENNYRAYVCVDDTTGAAVWLDTTSNDAVYLDNQEGDYYLARANHTGAQAINTVTGLQTALDGKEPAIGAKNTAFNKNFGSAAGTVTEGNDARLSDSRKCDNTFDDAATAKVNLSLSKSDVGLGNVEDTALSMWQGTANINTVGTVGTGTWEGSTIALDKGGTGATTAAAARVNLGLGTIAIQAANTVNIDGGAIDGTPIGANSADTGDFTALNTSGAVAMTNITESTSTTTGALIVAGGIGIAKNVNIGGDASVASDKAFYFGDTTTDGTWRIIRVGSDLVFQCRESGTYVDKLKINP